MEKWEYKNGNVINENEERKYKNGIVNTVMLKTGM